MSISKLNIDKGKAYNVANIECSVFNKRLYCMVSRDLHMKGSFSILCADRPRCNSEWRFIRSLNRWPCFAGTLLKWYFELNTYWKLDACLVLTLNTELWNYIARTGGVVTFNSFMWQEQDIADWTIVSI